MGRTGRYTLSVMVWVAAFVGWSGLVGVVFGAASGDGPSDSSATGVSALLYVVLPAVPTLVTLWFNDWARDGFPSADERRRGSFTRADRTLRDRPRARHAEQTAGASAPAPDAAAGTPRDAQSTAPAVGEDGETQVRSWADYAAGAGGTTISMLSAPQPAAAPQTAAEPDRPEPAGP
jgi:hypothetical protein